jgi:hypothetical protein
MYKVMPIMGEDSNTSATNGRTYLRRRTVNSQPPIAEEEANDWEAVSSEDESSESSAPRLTLMEQLVLLGLKDKQVRESCSFYDRGI